MTNIDDLGNSIMTIRYKLVFVGDICVGKTSVMNRFISNNFSGDYDVKKLIFLNLFLQATIGVDFSTKTIEYKGNSLKLQIWDSAGQERYKSLIPSYVRGASIIFILYDISNKNSFNNIITWIKFIKQVNTEECILVLCGNKIDLPRQVSTNEGKNLADKEKMFFFETSAKSGVGVDNMMYSCIALLPFFDQFKVDKKEVLIDELTRSNSSNINPNLNNKAFKEYFEPGSENSANIILTKQNNLNKEKKKCSC